MFTTSIVFSQSWKYDLDERDGLYYKDNSNTPFSGTNFSYWDNKKIRNKIFYKKGLRYKFSMHNKNGKKIYEDIIKNNIREETEWYENGKKKNHQFFLLQEEGGSMYTGKWVYWYENGKKEKERTYKDGKEISSKYWNEDGSVKE
jgi:antitoxin component YwqK of YwqJK toxin-antitoxin module